MRGNPHNSACHEMACGLSPRVRGNLGNCPVGISCGGSIPACAGEPRRGADRLRAVRVYPRVCGGTPLGALCLKTPRGPIPACAGEPAPVDSRGTERMVYPRVCGGTHPRFGWPAPPPRSIPACAGEPHPGLCPGRLWTVYPRVCGGTRAGDMAHGDVVGLSPRVRGNRRSDRFVQPLSGSIPACAGEPAGSNHFQ